MKLTINLRNPYKEFGEDVQKGRLLSGRECIFLSLGLALVILGVLFLNGINPLHASGNGWAAIVFGACWCVIPGLRIGTRFFVQRLISEDQFYERLNMDYHALNTLMREKDVRPRLIVGNKRYYARSDFGNVTSLLRASATPKTGGEMLLRVAEGQSQLSSQHLLHTVSDNPVQQTSPANTTVAPDESQNIQNSAL